MPVFDASSMIHAWDNYPLGQFPPLWRWMAEVVHDRTLSIPRAAFKEVTDKAPDCAGWLVDNEIWIIEHGNEIVQDALRIKGILGIINDLYHPDGVGENDLLIISSARAIGAELVSEENRQPTLPPNLARYKIPAVCAMAEVRVRCFNFVEFFKNSGRVFD